METVKPFQALDNSTASQQILLGADYSLHPRQKPVMCRKSIG